MWLSKHWEDFELIEAEDGYKLEKWKTVQLLRPDPQVVWKNNNISKFKNYIDAKYIRSSKGGGEWETYKKMPDHWIINYRDLKFKVRPTGFKHTGLFPEQAVNWDFAREQIKKVNYEANILNLFAYTGGATVACLKEGANVCHLDASKSIITWAKENVALNKLPESKVRYIIDDAYKFVLREIKREKKYDGIIMDPPSYGRGPNGELWKIEDKIFELIDSASQILSKKPIFFIVNTYTTGLSNTVMENILNLTVKKKFGGTVSADEIGFMTKNSGLYLPCGATIRWSNE
jgi:23S rRNA (cytosine1962-C5)-methyltransferase